MEKHLQLEVESREERGKNAARRLRAAGQVPATLYGLGQDPVSLAVDTKAMRRILVSQGDRNRVLELRGGASGNAMAGDYQVDPLSGALLHIDMRRIDLTVAIVTDVPVVTEGVAIGVKNEGGIEDVILREVAVECLPEDVPERIVIDVTPLATGEAVRVRDLVVSEKVKILATADAVVARIVGRRGEEEEEAAEAAAAAEAEEAAAAAAAAEAGEEEEPPSKRG